GAVYSWGIKNVASTQETAVSEIVLFRTDLSTKKSEILLRTQESAEEFKYTKSYSRDIQVSQNKIYIKNRIYDIEQDMFTDILYESDGTQGNGLKEVFHASSPRDCNNRTVGEEYTSLRNFAVDNEENMFYVDELHREKMSLNVALYKYNFNTMERSKICDFDSVVGYRVMCDDDFIYMNIYGDSINRLIVMDKTGKELYEKRYNSDEKQSAICDIVGVDKRYLIIATDENTDFSFNKEEKSEKSDTAKYAILRKDVIGTGNEEWALMYNGKFIQ
ncbi:MAG: hypothetical protein Q4F11_10105, partial [Eubacteriales bacterium]|nr:hypothetical protein [Eubacteriales bacterium]